MSDKPDEQKNIIPSAPAGRFVVRSESLISRGLELANSILNKPARPAILDEIDRLIAQFKDKDWQVCQAAAKTLGEIGEPAVQPLILALSDEDSDVRYGAAYGLGEIRDPRAVEPLIHALSDENSDVRAVKLSMG